MVRNRKTGTRERSKVSRAIAIFVAIYTLYNFLFAVTGLRLARANFAVGMTILMMALLGLTIGLVSVKLRRGGGSVSDAAQSFAKRASRMEESIAGAAAKAAKRATARPEKKTVQCAAGETHRRTVGEDCFVLSPRDQGARRREQLETHYRAGLYTREEYAAEREKIRARYGSI